jgi:hypothetical protein
VDNASQDGSVDSIRKQYPSVFIIENKENLGYARANNQGITASTGDLILLLNSDIEILTRDPLIKIRDFLDKNTNVGIVGAKLLLPNGRIQALGRRFISIKQLIKTQLLFSSAPFLKKRNIQDTKPVFADYIDGAFFCIRREVIKHIGLLEEDYFMYAEDMEWCMKARDAGWKVMALPWISVLHHHASSSKQNFSRILKHNTINNCRFLAKYRGCSIANLAFWIYAMGMVIRVFTSILRRNHLASEYVRGLSSVIQFKFSGKTL